MIVRVWWAAWVLNWALVLSASLWRLRDSLQAQADGVLFSAVVALVAAALALVTVHLMRRVDGLRWHGAARSAPTRWVVAVPGAAKSSGLVPRETTTDAGEDSSHGDSKAEKLEDVPVKVKVSAS